MSTTTAKAFWIKLGIFLTPILLYLGSTMGLGFRAGEFTSLRAVAERQAGSAPLTYGRAYRDNYFAFKLVSARVRKPRLLVLGSSRAMQFRAQLASRDPAAFYNAGGAVQGIFEVKPFLEGLASHDALPRILILGLDQPWFNSNSPRVMIRNRMQAQLDEEETTPLNRALNVSKSIFLDMVKGQIDPRQVLAGTDPHTGLPALGLSALLKGSGFRNDGSYQYGSFANPQPTPSRLAEGFQRLKDNSDHFAGGDRVGSPALRELESLLAYCRDKGILVYGYSPPYAPSICAAMATDGKHAYLKASADSLAGIFARAGRPYADFSDPTAIGGTDGDMIDAFHGSERLYLGIFLSLGSRSGGELDPYSDLAALDKTFRDSAPSQLLVFGPAVPVAGSADPVAPAP